MSTKHVGKQTIALSCPPSIAANACVGGKKEGEGPLKDSFDYIGEDSFFGETTKRLSLLRISNMSLRGIF